MNEAIQMLRESARVKENLQRALWLANRFLVRYGQRPIDWQR